MTKDKTEGFDRAYYDRVKASAEAMGYTVVTKWRKGLKSIRLGAIVLEDRVSDNGRFTK